MSLKKNNYLQVAFRSRIKFFYRPSSLKGSLAEAAKTLQWTHSGKGLHVKKQLTISRFSGSGFSG
ncbi:fimbria/pilus periplasmic chaperone [Enterobacter hormaechei]